MSGLNPASRETAPGPKDIEGLRGDGDSGAAAAHSTLQDHAGMASHPRSQNAALARDAFSKGKESGTPYTPHLELAMGPNPEGRNIGRTNEQKIAGKVDDSKAPIPLKEEYKKDAKSIPIYSYKDTMPTKERSWNPKTGELKESFHQPFGIKDPTKDYGGVLLSTQTSRTIARREEVQTADGKSQKVIEVRNMQGFDGYGSLGPITGHRKLDSVNMWQVNEGKDKDGNNVVKSYKQPTIYEKALWGKPYLKQQAKEPMLNDEFNRRWAELDPQSLQKIALGAPTASGKLTSISPMRKGVLD